MLYHFTLEIYLLRWILQSQLLICHMTYFLNDSFLLKRFYSSDIVEYSELTYIHLWVQMIIIITIYLTSVNLFEKFYCIIQIRLFVLRSITRGRSGGLNIPWHHHSFPQAKFAFWRKFSPLCGIQNLPRKNILSDEISPPSTISLFPNILFQLN